MMVAPTPMPTGGPEKVGGWLLPHFRVSNAYASIKRPEARGGPAGPLDLRTKEGLCQEDDPDTPLCREFLQTLAPADLWLYKQAVGPVRARPPLGSDTAGLRSHQHVLTWPNRSGSTNSLRCTNPPLVTCRGRPSSRCTATTPAPQARHSRSRAPAWEDRLLGPLGRSGVHSVLTLGTDSESDLSSRRRFDI